MPRASARRRIATPQPTIRDVASAAEVALGTVSRVINGHGNVSAELRTRVETAITKLGFVPDTAAQSLRGRATRSFACVMRDMTVPVLARFVDAMQRELDHEGYGLFVASSYHDPAREFALLRQFARRRVDGLVIATSSERDPQVLRALRNAPMPVTLLDRSDPAEMDAVGVDHASGTRRAIAHLLDLGHRRIAIISGEESLSPTRDRLRGYQDAFAERDLVPDPALVKLGSFSSDFAQAQAAVLLDQPDPPTAFFVAGTALLPGLLRVVHARRMRIPRDLSIVAGADSELAEFHSPGITVVRWDHGLLGAAAARFLRQRLQTPDARPQRARTEAEFILRGSCGAPPKRKSA